MSVMASAHPSCRVLSSSLLYLSYPRPAPRSPARLALLCGYSLVLPQRRWPVSHQTLCLPGVQVVPPLEVLAQTNLHLSQWLIVPWVRAVALCDTPCLLDRTRPAYIGVPM